MNAEVLKELREKTGLSAYAFGHELVRRKVVDLSRYYLYERGDGAPNTENLVKISEALASHLPGETTLSVLGKLLEVEA